jgi:pantothenate kinase
MLCALVIPKGNYLLLGVGAWTLVRAQLDQVWFCELDEDERMRRLVARHERFGKPRDVAVAWAGGPDQRNAELVAGTRDRADVVIPASVLRALPPG